jgi:hypothetical protein
MQNITYTTGRTYDAPQVLDITVLSDTLDEFGLRDIEVTFTDKSRHIQGKLTTIVFNGNIGQAVLEAYDEGRYTATFN